MDLFTFKTYSKLQVRTLLRALCALDWPGLKPAVIRFVVLCAFMLLNMGWPALAERKPAVLTAVRSYTGTVAPEPVGHKSPATASFMRARSALALDSDGDNVDDSVDLDDDNDGILDTAEMTCQLVTNGDFASTTGGWSFTGNVGITGGTLFFNGTNTTPDGIATQDIQTRAGKPYTLTFDFVAAGAGTGTIGVTADVLDVSTGTVLGTTSLTSTAGTPSSNISIPFTATGSSIRIRFTDISQATFSIDVAIDNVSILYCDTDNDGIPDSLDLDSDGDGCADAIEGGGPFRSNNLVNSTMAGGNSGVGYNGISTSPVTQNLGISVGATGIPTVAGTGQTVGFSQFRSLNGCIDSEDDTVADVEDLDDDNDGILDTDEMNCQLIENGDFESSTAGWSFTGNVGSTGGFLFFNGSDVTPNGIATQDIQTRVGQRSTLTFDFFAAGAGAGLVGVRIDVLDVSTGAVLATTSLLRTGNTPTVTVPLAFTATGTSTRIRFTDISQATVVIDARIDNVSILYCDTDNDGIANSLDLDSDGDGCADAIEGGASFKVADLVNSILPGGNSGTGYIGTSTSPVTQNLGTTVGTNGVPTVAGTGQTVGVSQLAGLNGCTDSDSDTVADIEDLDDDNDGILDTAENTCLLPLTGTPHLSWDNNGISLPGTLQINSLSPVVLETTSITTGPGITLGSSGDSWVISGATATNLAGAVAGNDYMQFTMATSATATVDYTLDQWASFQSTAPFQKIGIRISSDPTFATSTLLYDGANPNNATQNFFSVSLPDPFKLARGTTYFVRVYPYGGGGTIFDSFGFLATCLADTDGDAIANQLDLDSDGDGCPDAVEGGGPFKLTDLVSSTMAGGNSGTGFNGSSPSPVNQNLGTTVGATGIPTVAGTGQTLGISQTPGLNGCTDSDADGYDDVVDLDDDNDGILDTAEMACQLVNNGDFSSISAGWTFTGNVGVFSTDSKLYFNGSNTTPNGVASQVIQTRVGQRATLTFEMLASGGNSGSVGVQVDVLDVSTGSVLATTSLQRAANTPLVNGALGFVATGTTTRIRFTDISQATLGIDVQLDNVSILYCDTDNDGIPNSLDLDSDADGCADAVEGGGSFRVTDLVDSDMDGGSTSVSQNLGDVVGSTTTTMGVPVTAGTGQTVGVSQNGALNECTDSDGDGVVDLSDLDDDNDGILDTAECPNLGAWNVYAFARTASTFATNVQVIVTGFSSSTVTWNQTIAGTFNNGGFNWTPIASNVMPDANGKITATISSVGANNAFLLSDAFLFTNGTSSVVVDNAGAGYSKTGTWSVQTFAGNFGTSEDFIASPFAGQTSTFSLTVAKCDTDGDNIPNHIDLDSDGDGCADAIEGGANFTVANLVSSTMAGGSSNVTSNLGNVVGNTVTTMGVPVTAGTGQTVGTSQNGAVQDAACPQPDYDGDGVLDSTDLDDDNDGILDTVEDPACEKVANGSGQNNLAGWTVTGNVVSNTNPQIIFNNNETPATGVLSQMISTVPNQPLQVKFDMVGFGSNTAGNASLRVDVLTGSTVIATKTVTKTFGNPFTNETLSFLPKTNQTTIRFTDLSTVTSQFDPIISGISVVGACGLDSDNDGIINSLDLDSDGDGCPDALEGGAAFTTSNLVSSTMAGGSTNVTKNLPTPVGSGTATMGVPVTAGTGQTVGYSQNSSLNECIDTDGDGVADINDLDDDNDGILDVAEVSCVELIQNGVFPTTGGSVDVLAGWTVGGTYSANYPSTYGRVAFVPDGLYFLRDNVTSFISQPISGIYPGGTIT
ncbi:beta strand repeat-containing protein, partial [Spirosoma sp. 209]|uniref:beta strand repeat-containing protein n=1 Tax=Spirosoma sp. 209 TaxID=1955701 RepID=UPI0035132D39